MQKQSSALKRFGFLLIYIAVGIAATYLLVWFTQLYVELFGETYTPMTKLVAWTVSLIACLIIVFTANCFSLKLNSRRLGLSVSLIVFLSLYIVGPGIRAPVTLYITFVSFPYNINMLAVIVLPLLLGRLLYNRGI